MEICQEASTADISGPTSSLIENFPVLAELGRKDVSSNETGKAFSLHSLKSGTG